MSCRQDRQSFDIVLRSAVRFTSFVAVFILQHEHGIDFKEGTTVYRSFLYMVFVW